MKAIHSKNIPKYAFRPPELAEVFGSSEMGRRIAYHWLKPLVQGKRLTLYDAGDVAAAYQRLRSGELPPPIPRKVVA